MRSTATTLLWPTTSTSTEACSPNTRTPQRTVLRPQRPLGSARLMTAMDKSVFDSLDYLPFGEQIAGGLGTTHKFTGKERDSETGLDNFGARHLGSSMGQFMSPITTDSLSESVHSWTLNAARSANHHVSHRLDQAYLDKLDGKISEEFGTRKSTEWIGTEQQILLAIDGLEHANPE